MAEDGVLREVAGVAGLGPGGQGVLRGDAGVGGLGAGSQGVPTGDAGVAGPGAGRQGVLRGDAGVAGLGAGRQGDAKKGCSGRRAVAKAEEQPQNQSQKCRLTQHKLARQVANSATC